MDFDPDQYLKEKDAQFNPDSYIAEKTIKGLGSRLLGVGQAALNTAGGVVGQVAAIPAAGVGFISGALHGGLEGGIRHMADVYEGTIQGASNIGTDISREAGLPIDKGQEYTGDVNDFINRYLIALGPHTAHIEGGIPELRAGAALAKDNIANKVARRFGSESADRIPVSGFDNLAKQKSDTGQSNLDFNDPLTRAKFNAADEAQVARLQASLEKTNQPNPTINIDTQGRQYTPEQVAQLRQAGDEFGQIQRENQAQQAIQARQLAMEQEVARQTSLDMNAAERARQENAPTGSAQAIFEQGQREFQTAYAEMQKAEQQKAIADQQAKQAATDAEAIAAGKRQRDAQAALERRQAELELAVKQRQKLEAQAAERAKQQSQPVTSEQMMRDQEAKQAAEIQDSINKTQELNNRGQQMAIVEDYGNNDPMSRMPNMRVDENGIPIRADLSMEAQNLENPLQRNLWGDELAGKTGDNGVPLTQALDKMPPGPARDLAISQLSGQGRSSIGGSAPWKRQQGAVDFSDIAKAVHGIANTISSAIEKFPYARASGQTARDHLGKLVPETRDLLIKPPQWDSVKNEALSGKPLPDFGNIRSKTLSGPELTGEMYKNTATKWMSQWSQWAQKVGERNIKNLVRPVEHTFYTLNDKALIKVSEALLAESKHDVRFTPEELTSNGITGKALEAYQSLRKQLDDVFDKQVESHKSLGLEPPTKEEAYTAALRHGDYHVAVTTKGGQPIWYSRFESARDANRGLKWLKENVKRDDINWDAIKVENRASNLVRSLPRDILAEYQELSRMVDPEHPASQAIQEAIRSAQEDRGYTYQGQDKRFMTKTGVPGFEGNMPWLSGKENATRLIRSQLNYLENAHRWVPMQEALGQLKEMFADPKFNQEHASTAGYLRQVLDHVLGINKDPVRQAERYISNQLGFGSSRIGQVSSALKSFNSFQKLSGSVGYMLTTPLQAMNGIGLLSREVGLRSMNPITNINAIMDTSALLANAMSKFMGGPELPMTKLGKFATEYIESNNTNRSIISQHHELGSNPGMNLVRSTLGVTISAPEKLARTATTLTFAHHLMDAGYAGGDMLKIMQRAESLSNMVNTNYLRGELPMLFSSAGSMSSMWGQFKAPVFNFYNQLHGLSRDAAEGVKTKKFSKVAPLLTLLGATTFLAGIKNVPGVQELDGGWNLVKDGVAEWFPQQYNKVMGLGLRNYITNNVSEAAANGIASHITGASLGSRFSPNLLDVEHPLKNALPAIGPELSEWSGAAKIATDPFNKKNIEQFIYSAIANPMAKGLMENNLDDFKSPFVSQDPNKTNFRKASNIKSPELDYQRTEREKTLRNLGLRSIKEADTREQRYAVSQENARVSNAYDQLIRDTSDAMASGDKERAAQKANAALRLIPDATLLQSSVSKYMQMASMTPEQRELARSNNVKALQMLLARKGQSLYGNN